MRKKSCIHPDMLWSRGKLSIFSAVTVFALLLNALLPLSLAYGTNLQSLDKLSQAELELLFASTDEIVLCTAEGVITVSLLDIQNGKVPTGSHLDYECALCYLTALSLTIGNSADVSAVVYAERSRRALRPIDDAKLDRQHVIALVPTRGPPQHA